MSLPLEPALDFDAGDDRPDEDRPDGHHQLLAADFDSGSESANRLLDQFDPTSALVSQQGPSFLLIESLVWQLAGHHEPNDSAKQKQLYSAVCEVLESKKLIGSTYKLEALHSIRSNICYRLNNLVGLIRAGRRCWPALQKTRPGQERMNHPLQVSKYLTDFVDLGLIEQGGFGSVFKARHKFDDCLYAVKMIRFRFKSDESSFKKIIREVQLYANLSNHPHVVGYKTAWQENWCLHDERLPGDGDAEDHLQPEPNSTAFRTANSRLTVDEGLSIRFDESANSGIRVEHSDSDWIPAGLVDSSSLARFAQIDQLEIFNEEMEGVAEEDFEQDKGFENGDAVDGTVFSSTEWPPMDVSIRRKKTVSVSSTKSNSDSVVQYGHDNFALTTYRDTTIDLQPGQPIPGCLRCQFFADGVIQCNYPGRSFGAVLYIQMELCGKNLKTWLRQRNQTIFDQAKDSSDFLSLVEANVCLDIFRQVVDGVSYIHSMNLIHRDLKPQNILFSVDESQVKIGDFGLATLHKSIDDREIALHNQSCFCQVDPSGDWQHTGGLGTSIYAAPEQRRQSGNGYDHRADMYSLGVILLELFHPFATDMERCQSAEDVRKHGRLPQEVDRRWPTVGQMIRRLCDVNPSRRPTANDVLKSDLFRNETVATIEKLETELTRMTVQLQLKDREATVLRSVIAIQDEQLAEKQRQIEELTKRLNS